MFSPPLVRSISMDLTEHCNLACSYCFTQSDHSKRVMSREMGERILSWIIPQGPPDVTFECSWWGGEPLLEYNLIKHLLPFAREIAKQHNRRITFGGTTNGILYTPEKVEWLAQNESAMLVSLDGIQPAHDCARKTKSGKGSWKTVDKNLRAALKIFPGQRIRSSLSVENLPYFFESVVYFIEDLGLHNIAFSPVYEGNWDDAAFELLEEQFTKIIDFMILRSKQGTPFIIKHINDGALIGDNLQNKQNPCGAGNGYVGFSYDGFIFPCHRFNKHGLSSEERARLPHVIGVPVGDTFQWVNQDFRKTMVEFLDIPPVPCPGCEIYRKSTCNGNCYAVNYDLTGHIKKVPDFICRFQHVQQKFALLYRDECKKLGLPIQESGWSGGVRQDQKSCVCYNACYMEGTQDEQIHIEGLNDMSCLCYNTNYAGPAEPQYRTKVKIQEEHGLIAAALDMLINTEPVNERRDLMQKVRKLL